MVPSRKKLEVAEEGGLGRASGNPACPGVAEEQSGDLERRGKKESSHPSQWPPEKYLGVMGDDPTCKPVSYSPKQRL